MKFRFAAEASLIIPGKFMLFAGRAFRLVFD